MAKQEFLENVRLARNLLVHRVEADRPDINAEAVARRLSRAALWLTPASVRDFEAADFPELPEAAREDLERAVRQFREVAEQVPDDGPATADQEVTASRSLLNIARILEPYFPTPQELDRLRAAMRAVHFPADVVETWYPEFGLDSSGDPAVWIWLVVDDAVANDPTFTTTTTRLQREIHQSLERVGLNRWPYVRLRTVSEQRSLQAVGQ
jgi:hypothetical protein